MVLLKNDGVLPLKTSGIKIAVVGPLADQTKVLLGNYNGMPTHTVSVLEGLQGGVSRRRRSTYVAGHAVPEQRRRRRCLRCLTTGRQAGVKAEYIR